MLAARQLRAAQAASGGEAADSGASTRNTHEDIDSKVLPATGAAHTAGEDGDSDLKKVRVFVRIRPRLPHEVQAEAATANLTSNAARASVTVGNTKAVATGTFEFDGVLVDNVEQQTVYDSLAVEVGSPFRGNCVSFLAYGLQM